MREEHPWPRTVYAVWATPYDSREGVGNVVSMHYSAEAAQNCLPQSLRGVSYDVREFPIS